MSEVDAGGLRERKRRATQQAIERGAIELAIEHGYEKVTVEMICEYAMISERTFFNYAGSKERAVLGIDTPVPGDEHRRAYIAGRGGSPLQDLVTTISEVFLTVGAGEADLFRKRRQVLQGNPDLALKEFARMEEAQVSIIDLVQERLRSESLKRDDTDLHEEARMVVSMTFGIAHYIVRDWIEDGFPSDATELLEQATELARKVASA
ncbi:MAG: TetR/AcrR family transcriptional regulator [Leucobacter sp.]